MSSFDIDYSNGYFYLQYEGDAIDVFSTGRIAKLRLLEAQKIERKVSEDPHAEYQRIFNVTQERLEYFKNERLKNEIKAKRSERRKERKENRIGF